jgi:4'-phosphopantetheinyl transferase
MVGQTWKPARSVEIRLVSLQAADLTFVSLLSRPERERLDRIVVEADRARFLLGAVLLRQGVGEHLGIDPKKVEIDRTCTTCGAWHGRPTVPGSNLHLSVAHSGTLVAVAIAAEYRIGIDVEKIDGRPAEQIRRWTVAEARFKAGGDDLAVYEISPPQVGYLATMATDAPTLLVPQPPKFAD